MPRGLLAEFTILDALENFFRGDIYHIADHYAKAVRDNIEVSDVRAKDLRFGELLGMYSETWANPLHERELAGDSLLPPPENGELRLPVSPSPREIIQGSYVQLRSDMWTYAAHSQWKPQIVIPSIKRTLLYAHSVILDCQIAEMAVGNKSLSATADWLQLIAELSPLIRDGIVLVSPIPNLSAQPLWARVGILGFSAGSPVSPSVRKMDAEADALYSVTEFWSSVQASRFEMLAGNAGLAVPANEHLQRRVLSELSRIRPTKDDIKEAYTAREIGRLDLPGLRDLRIRDMVKVREDDAFSEFRATLRKTLAASTYAAGDVSESLFKEEMGSEVRKLERGIKKSSIMEITLPKVLNWSVAAIAGWSVAGWAGAVAGIAGESLAEEALERPKKSDRALLAHMVAVGK